MNVDVHLRHRGARVEAQLRAVGVMVLLAVAVHKGAAHRQIGARFVPADPRVGIRVIGKGQFPVDGVVLAVARTVDIGQAAVKQQAAIVVSEFRGGQWLVENGLLGQISALELREPNLLPHVGKHHHAAMFILNLKPADAALIAERRCFQLPVLQENQRTVAEKRRAEIHACKLHIPKYLLIS